MPKRQTQNSFPSPLHQAFLITIIAIGALSAVLLAFGTLGNFFTSPQVIKQAQAIESPTGETVEPTTEIPTSDLTAALESTATAEPSATLVVTETATLEPLPTLSETETPTAEPTAVATAEPTLPPTKTVVVETPIVTLEPTQTEIPAIEIPRDTPTITAEPSPTHALATDTPVPEIGIILFEGEGNLFIQSVDSAGNSVGGVEAVNIAKSPEENITDMMLSPDADRALLFIQTPNVEGEQLFILSPETRNAKPLFGGERLQLGTKILGWHSNSREIVYWDGESIWLLNTESDERRILTNPQTWENLSYPPLIDSVSYSPEGNAIVASYSISGQDGHVFMLNANGSNARPLFKENYRITSLSWSPNGKMIAFAGDGVELMDRNGSGLKKMGDGFIGGKPPVWSPDSWYIAYTADFHPNYRINIVDVETGAQFYIGDDSMSAVLPDWAPEGSSIIFLYGWNDKSGAKEIWVANQNGKELHPINTDGRTKRIGPIWISQ